MNYSALDVIDSSGACEESQTWLWCYADAMLQGLSSLVHVPRALNVVYQLLMQGVHVRAVPQCMCVKAGFLCVSSPSPIIITVVWPEGHSVSLSNM